MILHAHQPHQDNTNDPCKCFSLELIDRTAFNRLLEHFLQQVLLANHLLHLLNHILVNSCGILSAGP